MNIARHIEGIRDDIAAAAALGGEEVAEAGRRLAQAVEPSLHLRLLDLLADAALTVDGQLDDARVEVRMLGREPDLVVVHAQEPAAEPAPGDDLSARITLRLPEALKVSLEAAATREGISVNALIVRSLSRALDARPTGRRVGNRLSGFAQS